MEETEFRDRLHGLAQRSAPPPMDADDLIATLVERGRAGRRRQFALGAVVAVVLAVVAVVPAVRSALDRDPAPAAPSDSVDVYGGPTRGSLADDADFLDGVRRIPWASEGYAPYPAPPVAERHVVWAGDVNGARWALVAGDNALAVSGPSDEPEGPPAPGEPGTPDSVAVAWFLGPERSGAELMTLSGVQYGLSPNAPTALLDVVTGTAVIVGRPEDRIEVSLRPWIAGDASVSRDYEPVPAVDGVAALVDDDDTRLQWAMRYRVLRGGAWVSERPGVHATFGSEVPVREFLLDRLRPAPPSALGDAAVPEELENVLALTGLTPDEVTFTVVWAGDVPLETGEGSARVTLVAAELPSGAFYVTAVVGWDAGGGQLRSAPCASEIRPAGTLIDQQLFVLGCTDIAAGHEVPFDSLVVVAPPGTATAQARTPNGDVKYSYTLTDGVTVAPMPTGVTDVQILDASGTVVGQGNPHPPEDLSETPRPPEDLGD